MFVAIAVSNDDSSGSNVDCSRGVDGDAGSNVVDGCGDVDSDVVLVVMLFVALVV